MRGASDRGLRRERSGACRPRSVLTALALAALIATGCGDDSDTDDSDTGSEVPNPASEFCVDQGGEVDIVDEDDGQVGYCELPDGTRVEEWEYFRENSDDS